MFAEREGLSIEPEARVFLNRFVFASASATLATARQRNVGPLMLATGGFDPITPTDLGEACSFIFGEFKSAFLC